MKNKVIIFPTDTVYGIGASVFDECGINRIYKIKNRPLNKPLAVLCADINQIKEIAVLNDLALKLIGNFMPGCLTIIVPAKDNIKKTMNINTIGIRIPKYNKALELLKEYGPLATTSVNESGKSPINDYEQIVKEYSSVVDLIVPPTDEKSSSVSSSVVDLTNERIKVLREGSISILDINKVINNE